MSAKREDPSLGILKKFVIGLLIITAFALLVGWLSTSF